MFSPEENYRESLRWHLLSQWGLEYYNSSAIFDGMVHLARSSSWTHVRGSKFGKLNKPRYSLHFDRAKVSSLQLGFYCLQDVTIGF